MYTMLKLWLDLKSDRRAVTALEYGLMAALIAGLIITAATGLSTSISNVFNKMASALNSAKAGVQ